MDIPDSLNYELLSDVTFSDGKPTTVKLRIWGIAQNAEVDITTRWVSDAKDYDDLAAQLAERVLGPMLRKPLPDEVMPE